VYFFFFPYSIAKKVAEGEVDDSCRHLLRRLCWNEMATPTFLLWFCYEEGDNSNVVAFLYVDDFYFIFGAYGLVH
jgi:hypothetical protein